jgi:hypothetical protein
VGDGDDFGVCPLAVPARASARLLQQANPPTPPTPSTPPTPVNPENSESDEPEKITSFYKWKCASWTVTSKTCAAVLFGHRCSSCRYLVEVNGAQPREWLTEETMLHVFNILDGVLVALRLKCGGKKIQGVLDTTDDSVWDAVHCCSSSFGDRPPLATIVLHQTSGSHCPSSSYLNIVEEGSLTPGQITLVQSTTKPTGWISVEDLGSLIRNEAFTERVRKGELRGAVPDADKWLIETQNSHIDCMDCNRDRRLFMSSDPSLPAFPLPLDSPEVQQLLAVTAFKDGRRCRMWKVKALEQGGAGKKSNKHNRGRRKKGGIGSKRARQA